MEKMELKELKGKTKQYQSLDYKIPDEVSLWRESKAKVWESFQSKKRM